MNLNLSNKTFIIIGGGQGLGAGTALSLGDEGAHVIIADINETTGKKMAATLSEKGVQSCFLPVDMGYPDQISSMIQSALTHFPRIDGLINFAGPAYKTGFADSTYEDWRFQLRIHLEGSITACQAIVPHFKENRYGKIVLIGSFGAYVAAQSPYGLSKSSIISFSKGLAAELAPYTINVHCISPGFIRTPMLELGYPTESEKYNLIQGIPMKRLGNIEEIANLVLYLCSDLSGYITGTNIDINGGLYIAP